MAAPEHLQKEKDICKNVSFQNTSLKFKEDSNAFFLCVFFQSDVDVMVPFVFKAQPAKHVIHLFSSIGAENIQRIPWLVGQSWASLKVKMGVK